MTDESQTENEIAERSKRVPNSVELRMYRAITRYLIDKGWEVIVIDGVNYITQLGGVGSHSRHWTFHVNFTGGQKEQKEKR